MSAHYSMPHEFTCVECERVRTIDLTPGEAAPERCARCRRRLAEVETLRSIVRKLAAGQIFYAINEAKEWAKANPESKESP